MTEQQMEGATRWERRKELTHQRLIEAGERLFLDQGFDATTVEEIAVASDVAKGTFFNYFPSKEALLGEILYLRTQPILLSPPGQDAPTQERIWRLLRAVRSALAPFTSLFPRMFSYALSNPPLPAPTSEQATLSAAIARLVAVGQQSGEFRNEADAETVGVLVATYFFRLCMLESVCEHGAASSWEAQMRIALNVIYLGLMPASSATYATE